MEAAEQKAFVQWFKAQYPAHAKSLRVSLRGINLGSGARAGRMMNYINSQGSVDGEADLAILVPKGGFGSLLVEHKGEGMARKLTDEQSAYLSYHRAIGNHAVSTRGLAELCSVVEQYMGL